MRQYRIEEVGFGNYRLGRHVRHDPRSRLYAARSDAELVTTYHHRYIPILDQGDLGSCVGNASEGCLGTYPFYDSLADGWFANYANDLEAGAVDIYSKATGLDPYPGEWPPTDTGSDGLSGAQACQQLGLISGYTHAFSLQDALATLTKQPVITGIAWWSSFDFPDSDGLITKSASAYIRGGHEVVVDGIDVEEQLVWFCNSWGEGWGLGGKACMSWNTWGNLLADDGDVTVFTPITEPAPQPVPDPINKGCLPLASLFRRS